MSLLVILVLLLAVAAGFLFLRSFWRGREQRRNYRVREEQRRAFWGWE